MFLCLVEKPSMMWHSVEFVLRLTFGRTILPWVGGIAVSPRAAHSSSIVLAGPSASGISNSFVNLISVYLEMKSTSKLVCYRMESFISNLLSCSTLHLPVVSEGNKEVFFGK